MDFLLTAMLETLGVILLALFGCAAGVYCSKLPGGWWTIGYFGPFLMVALVAIPRWWPRVEIFPPFCWLLANRNEFALMAFVSATLLTTPLSRLPQSRERLAVVAFMVFFIGLSSVSPFLLPGLQYRYFSNLKTTVDGNGGCKQSNDYSCGPAADVTALRAIGVAAEEGELAIEAKTTALFGTAPDLVCGAIRQRYGIPCTLEHRDNLSEMAGHEPWIAIVRYNFNVDPYVAVLGVRDSEITVGIPLLGRRHYTPDQFLPKWRKSAILFKEPD